MEDDQTPDVETFHLDDSDVNPKASTIQVRGAGAAEILWSSSRMTAPSL